MGVYDRIQVIKDKSVSESPTNRPQYVYQIPLSFIPGIGNKVMNKLIDNFDTEMNILHKISFDDLEAVVGEKLAKNIMAAREGKLGITEGGGRNIW